MTDIDRYFDVIDEFEIGNFEDIDILEFDEYIAIHDIYADLIETIGEVEGSQ